MTATDKSHLIVLSDNYLALRDRMDNLQVSATCARLILKGLRTVEEGGIAYEPLAIFLERLEEEVGCLVEDAAELGRLGR